MLSIWMTVIVSGLTMGAIYALVAEGLNLIWGVMGVVNLAHGEFLMLGAYTTFWAWALRNVNPLLTILISFPVLFMFGALVNEACVKRVVGAPPLMSMLLTFGISILLTNLGVVAFGGKYRAVRFLPGTVSFGGVSIPEARLVAALVAVALSVAMYVVLKRTRIGMAIRAVSIDRTMAEQCGVDARRVYTVTFGIGAGLAAVAGTLVTMIFAFNPMVGQAFILKAFAVVVLGGMGNFIGALLGGLVIGLVESTTAFFYSVHLSEALAFAVIIVTLVVRPSGLLGGRA